MNDYDKSPYGDHKERISPLWISIVSGITGVLFDLDHFYCAITKGVPWWNTHGCKPFHVYLVPVACICSGIAITCLFGWACVLVYLSFKPTTS